jgi:peptidoglycan/xylan/chitin deacetylase (PgdA/CDA1 family)
VIAFPPRLFRDGMARFDEWGFRTLGLPDVVGYLKDRTPLPERSVLLTFDDGYRSVYDEAFPVLRRHGMRATVFLTVGTSGGTDPDRRLPSLSGRAMLSWGEIREMRDAGIEFGAHTLTHPDLTLLESAQIEREIGDSKAIVEDALGGPVSSFAYPYGSYDRRSRDVARRHFACAFSDTLGLIGDRSDPHALERVDAYYLRGGPLFDLMQTGLFPWYVRVRAVPRRLRRSIHRRFR